MLVFKAIRILLGVVVLMVPLALAHRTLSKSPGSYRDSATKGSRGVGEDYTGFISKAWRLEAVKAELAQEQAKLRDLEEQLEAASDDSASN